MLEYEIFECLLTAESPRPYTRKKMKRRFVTKAMRHKHVIDDDNNNKARNEWNGKLLR